MMAVRLPICAATAAWCLDTYAMSKRVRKGARTATSDISVKEIRSIFG